LYLVTTLNMYAVFCTLHVFLYNGRSQRLFCGFNYCCFLDWRDAVVRQHGCGTQQRNASLAAARCSSADTGWQALCGTWSCGVDNAAAQHTNLVSSTLAAALDLLPFLRFGEPV
jgi:hypothetical protein